ncbi:MAG: dimethylamine monooxygenase subunit DmmA family protein [Rhodobacteraceae bacterium]|nr:dimethylamine monooxygenase subunit DmmA family protein [Paracoccaceae bacterium]
MSQTVFEKSIRSRPVYGVLQPRAGTAHLCVADGEGAGAIRDLFAKAGADAPAMLTKTHIIYVPGANGTDEFASLEALGAAQCHRSPSFWAAESRLRKVLADAHMGLQVYLAGTETLIGLAQRDVMEAGLPHDAVQTEHRGSLSRRVQCVHCKGITENVTTDPYVCSHCGLNLFVRDHYSRRLAAFQGVNIDAEEPGNVPPAVERFK